MQYLRTAQIRGDEQPVAAVKELFGGVYFEQRGGEGLWVPRTLRNIYASDQNSPLYLLVPEAGEIGAVWPGMLGQDASVKLGFATGRDGGQEDGFAVRAVGLQLPSGVGLYFCLTPNGAEIKSGGALGI